MKKNNIIFLIIVKNLYIKKDKINVEFLFIYLFKINMIFKFFFIIFLSKSPDFTSIWDLSDLVLKIIEESKDIKIDKIKDQLEVLQIEIPKKEQFDAAEMERIGKMSQAEFLDFLWEHKYYKLYWCLLTAYIATPIFCIWLIHYILSR